MGRRTRKVTHQNEKEKEKIGGEQKNGREIKGRRKKLKKREKGNKREKGKNDTMKIGTEGKIFFKSICSLPYSQRQKKTEVQRLKLISLNILTDNSSH